MALNNVMKEYRVTRVDERCVLCVLMQLLSCYNNYYDVIIIIANYHGQYIK